MSRRKREYEIRKEKEEIKHTVYVNDFDPRLYLIFVESIIWVPNSHYFTDLSI